MSGDETNEIAAPPGSASSEHTVRLPAATSRPRPGYLALLFCAVAAGGFLVGIAVAAGSRTPPAAQGQVVAAQRVGPSGGTVRFDGGFIEIPPGAMGAPARITVRRTVFSDRVRVLPSQGTPEVYNPGGLEAYSFGPRDIEFLRPVEIVFRLPAASRNGTTFARRGNAIVMLGGSVDTDRRTATITVRDFRFAQPHRRR